MRRQERGRGGNDNEASVGPLPVQKVTNLPNNYLRLAKLMNQPKWDQTLDVVNKNFLNRQ